MTAGALGGWQRGRAILQKSLTRDRHRFISARPDTLRAVRQPSPLVIAGRDTQSAVAAVTLDADGSSFKSLLWSALMRPYVFAASRPPEISGVRDSDGWQFETKALAPDFAHFEVRALTSANPTISIFDYIGDDGAGGGVSPTRIAAALRSIGKKPITVEINSPGGSYFDGVAIYNLIRRHDAPVNVQVLGIAASAASLIAMAGDEIEIAHNGQFMIHNARGIFYGTAAEMGKAKATLEQIDEDMGAVYAARTGQGGRAISGMMQAETYIKAEDAVRLGFADSVMKREAQPVAYAAASAEKPSDAKSLDRLLAKQGMTRADRRDLFRAIKAGGPLEQSDLPRNRDRSALIAALTSK